MSSSARKQVAWLKEEPPVIYAGECQYTVAVIVEATDMKLLAQAKALAQNFLMYLNEAYQQELRVIHTGHYR